MRLTRDTSRGQLVSFTFGQDALAASQSDVQLPIMLSEASAVLDGYPVPFKGQIVAVSARTSVAATTGSMSVGATINGNEVADSTVTLTTGTVGTEKVARGNGQFEAGDVIGAELTTGASWDGTSADLVVVVWAVVQMGGI